MAQIPTSVKYTAVSATTPSHVQKHLLNNKDLLERMQKLEDDNKSVLSVLDRIRELEDERLRNSATLIQMQTNVDEHSRDLDQLNSFISSLSMRTLLDEVVDGIGLALNVPPRKKTLFGRSKWDRDTVLRAWRAHQLSPVTTDAKTLQYLAHTATIEMVLGVDVQYARLREAAMLRHMVTTKIGCVAIAKTHSCPLFCRNNFRSPLFSYTFRRSFAVQELI
ncbi:hypothetical protein B0H17DRAFT_1334168 [Mycena rosella]|uniref:Uncharacterized protein n=1 Tax=Mycena rosella TaxID=1033263 RepID=A0AAD7D4M2_MYCRO|nr:hypothetical protein B0H17DRAFT_1334168 [Mycena rosella]